MNELRFLTQEQYTELINFYHLTRAAGAVTKYDRMLKASKWFSEKHPEISSTAAYKDLSTNIQ